MTEADRRQRLIGVDVARIAHGERAGEVARGAADDGEQMCGRGCQGESVVPMIQTVLPGTVQGCKLSGSRWNGSAGTATHSPLGTPEGAYSSCDAVRLP